jgi:hypothetical protein
VLVTSRCAADTIPQSTPFWRWKYSLPALSSEIHNTHVERNIWQTIEVGMNQKVRNGDTFLVRKRNYGEQLNASFVEKTEKIRCMEERLNETNEARNLLGNVMLQLLRHRSYSPNMEKKLSIQLLLAVLMTHDL